jgi:hypothetical protein
MSRGYGARQLEIIWHLAQASDHVLCSADIVHDPNSASETASFRRARLTLKRDGLIDEGEYWLGHPGRPSRIRLTGKGLELARQRGWI